MTPETGSHRSRHMHTKWFDIRHLVRSTSWIAVAVAASWIVASPEARAQSRTPGSGPKQSYDIETPSGSERSTDGSPSAVETETADPDRRDLSMPEGRPAEPGETIDEVRVAGNRRVRESSILDRVQSQAGDELSRETISEDIHRLFRLDYFQDIRVDATETADGRVIVTFVVAEKPAIAEIRFEGNDQFNDDKLEKQVTVKEREILDVGALETSTDKIKQKYTDKGYYLAEVDYRLEPQEGRGNLVDVVFEIREFAKVEVKRVTILGNEAIPDEELERRMKTREGNLLSLVSQMGRFREEDFEKDLRRLRAYYYSKGYIEASVEIPTIRLSRDKRYLFITLRVQEGLQYDVGEIDVAGDLLLDREKTTSMIGLQEGNTFSGQTLRNDLQRFQSIYKNRGYAYARILPQTKPDRENQTVDVTYRFRKGEKVRFGRIEIVGNTKTRDRVIRRELEIREGEWYSKTAVERSKRGIKRLGYFEKVEITTQRSDQSGYIDATVQVQERKTGNFQVGAGFSSTESFIFNAKISQDNLFGRGQSLGLRAQISAIRTMFNLDFREPWLFGSRWQFNGRAFNFQYAFQDFTRTSTGGELSLGYPISELFDWNLPGDLVLSGSYTLENIDLDAGGRSGGRQQRPAAFFRGGLISSVGGELLLDTRNNRLFPSSGQYHSAKVEFAHDDITGSETEFVKYDLESRVYIPLVWEFVLRLNGTLGFVTNFTSDEPVPLSERYFVGGPRTTRGFERFTLGPSLRVARSGSDPASSLSNFRIGGTKQLLLTAEVEFPIFAPAGLKGVVFADAGNAFDAGQPFTLALDVFENPQNGYSDALRTAVGFGVRWRSPIAPLRFEWGIPLQRLPGEKPIVFHFTLGNAF